MILFKRSSDLAQYIATQKKEGGVIGFVPTMGALHQGHLSLIEASKAESDLTVCSIFINPTQFNNPEDFEHYPVTIEKDIESLIGAGCDVLFLPSVSEVYPDHYQKKAYQLGYLETVLEGAHRPGHYQGVCQVVDRLLKLVQPEHLYLGQKDFQQCLVIKKLVQEEFNNSIVIRIIPTLRGEDGLAMSSRNLRLTPEQRAIAPQIYKQLHIIQQNLAQSPFHVLEQEAVKTLEEKGFAVDYISIRNGKDLSGADAGTASLVVLAAASMGSVRLIDNVVLNNK
jgi:pantoate--beta-alanine ligase